jgi:hypothetical protein
MWIPTPGRAEIGLFLVQHLYRKNPCGYFLEIVLKSVTAAGFENPILDSFLTLLLLEGRAEDRR